jgi:toxin-antitoxin system PIN domain toxin
VTLLDVNVLVYVYHADLPEHLRTNAWLKEQIAEGRPLAVSWPTLWGFLRISTNPRAWKAPMSVGQVFGIVNDLMELPEVFMLNPGPRHAEILEMLVQEYKLVGPRMSDAVLAAIAIEHGASIASTDRDFRRFETVRWVNPLAG